MSMTMVLKIIFPAETPPGIRTPLFLEHCPAGFPSPAQDYIESELDLNDYCIRHPSATYFIRAIGNSMTDMGLQDGDLLVVDKSVEAQHGDIVIAEIDGEFTVKRLLLRPRPALQPMNSAYPTLYPENMAIFGVVMHFIHSAHR
jgi:DNA polymerase V